MRLIRFVISTVLLFAAVGAIGLYLALQYFSRDLPDYSTLADYQPPVVTRLHAADGRLMAEYAIENRVFVPFTAIPDHVAQAFVSAEDKNFYTHGGVDYLGMARAFIQNIRNIQDDRRLVGASTITQQVAKNFLLTSEQTYTRKIREVLLAFRIENAFTKQQILELYLNDIYLGRGAYGVAAAALAYFNKPLPELTLAQAAYLAALPKAPSNYDPVTNRDAAVERRNYVLDRMLEDGAITVAAAQEAKATPLETESRTASEFITADYFAEEVRRELKQIYGDAAVYEGGLSVRTSLNPRYQSIADRVLRAALIEYDRERGYRGPVARLEHFDDWPGQLNAVDRPGGAGVWQLGVVLEVLPEMARIGLPDRSQGIIPVDELTWARKAAVEGVSRMGPRPNSADDVLTLGDVVLVEPLDGRLPVTVEGAPSRRYGLRQIPEIQGGLVAMDPHTGRVLAVTGGFSYEISEFNRATQALRQPGSAFKPFVYLAALNAGYSPATIVLDTPIEIDLGPQMAAYRPSNYSNDFLGPISMRTALERSRNVVSVRLMMEVGLQPVHDIARNFGVIDDMPLYYSMGLGAGETTLLRMTTAYAMIANGGRRITPTFIDRIQDRTGRTIYRHDDRMCDGCVQVAWSGQGVPMLPDDKEQINDPLSVYQLISMMQGVVQRGTAARLNSLGFPLAGKTGTTNDAKDAWFIGFTPDLVVGVFMGFDNPRSLGSTSTGGSLAVPVFGAFVQEALQGQEVPGWRLPSDASVQLINPNTGQVARPGEQGVYEVFRPGTEPVLPTAIAPIQPIGAGVPVAPGGGFGASPPPPPAAPVGAGGLY